MTSHKISSFKLRPWHSSGVYANQIVVSIIVVHDFGSAQYSPEYKVKKKKKQISNV